MAPIKAVKEPEPDPKKGKARAKSGVRFPYHTLDDCIQVARTIHERAGGVCSVAQLATLLDYSGVRNGAFRTRMSATRMFGLIEEADEQNVKVSARGLAIVAEISESLASKARVEAFMAVELFKKVYDRFDGTTLPGQAGLQNLLSTEYQIVTDRVAPTVRILLDSADQAGLFKTAGNRTRMTMPLTGASRTAPNPPATPPQSTPELTVRHGGNGGGDGPKVDPAIMGLLERLPPGGTPLSTKKRKTLIEAFTATVNFIYPEAEESSE